MSESQPSPTLPIELPPQHDFGSNRPFHHGLLDKTVSARHPARSMMRPRENPRPPLDALLQSNGFSNESRFYRCTLPEFLKPGPYPETFFVSANCESPESVVDVYGGGHIAVAEQVGAGLAFAEQRENQWGSPDRKCVEVLLGDVLAQGGLVYPVESVVTERVWYLTLPTGAVQVREVRPAS